MSSSTKGPPKLRLLPLETPGQAGKVSNKGHKDLKLQQGEKCLN